MNFFGRAWKEIYWDISELPQAYFRVDPSCRSKWEVVFLYPGFKAILLHRLAHVFWEGNLFFVARLVSEVARFLTGIEIHPGAIIGRRLVIDHGIGVVVGETAQLGNDITLYQGVTLGATRFHKGKRHPTLENGVVVGAGASILGDIVVGTGAKVGAGAVILKPVASHESVYGIPATKV